MIEGLPPPLQNGNLLKLVVFNWNPMEQETPSGVLIISNDAVTEDEEY